MKSTSSETTTTLPPALLDELDTFLSFVPPARLSKNLRRLLLLYLGMDRHQHGMDLDFGEQTEDLYYLFELLDVMEEVRR